MSKLEIVLHLGTNEHSGNHKVIKQKKLMPTEMTKALQKRNARAEQYSERHLGKMLGDFYFFSKSNLLKQRPVLQNINYMTSTRNQAQIHGVFIIQCFPNHAKSLILLRTSALKEKHFFLNPERLHQYIGMIGCDWRGPLGWGKSLITEYLKIRYHDVQICSKILGISYMCHCAINHSKA